MNKNAPTVLYVDDAADYRELVRGIFTTSGLLIQFEDANQALNWLSFNHPAAIISDLRMDLVDGLSFMAKVRSTPGLASVPFVLFSSDPSLGMGLSLQADACVSKLNPNGLRTAIFNLIGPEGRYFAASAAVAEVRTEIDRARTTIGKAAISSTGWDQVARELAAHQRTDELTDMTKVLARVQSILEGYS